MTAHDNLPDSAQPLKAYEAGLAEGNRRYRERNEQRIRELEQELADEYEADKEIQSILKEVNSNGKDLPKTDKYSKSNAKALLDHAFDKDAILRKRLPYERLDQLTVDILTGTR